MLTTHMPEFCPKYSLDPFFLHLILENNVDAGIFHFEEFSLYSIGQSVLLSQPINRALVSPDLQLKLQNLSCSFG